MPASFFLVECGRCYDRLWQPIPQLDLPFAVEDLGRFYKFIKTNFVNPNIDIVSSDLSTCRSNDIVFGVRANILQSFYEFCGRTKNSDIRVFYYAGHGVVSEGELYLVPVDFRRELPDETGIPLSLVLSRFQGLPGENLVVLDCCRQSARIEAMPTMSEFSLRLSERTHVILGCSDGEACHESGHDSVRGGIFTAAFLKALGECDQSATLFEFFESLKSLQMDLVTQLVRDRSQTPKILTLGENGIRIGSFLSN